MAYIPYLALVAGTCWVLARMRRGSGHPRVYLATWAGLIAAGILVTAIVSTGRGTPFGDFDKAYYPAGRAAVEDPAALYDCGHADGLCFVSIPVVALGFAPLAALPLNAAHAIVMSVNVLSVAAAIGLLIVLAGARGWTRYAVVSAVLLNGPLYYSLRLGNLTHVVLVLLVLAMLALQRQRPALGGALLAICTVLKPLFLIWLPYLALRERRRAPLAFVLTIAGLLAISVAWFGPALHYDWFAKYIGGPSSRPVGAYNAQSFSGALIRLTTSVHLVDWTGLDVSPLLKGVQLVLTLGSLGVLAVAVTRGRRDDAAALAEYSCVLCTMLLISPISWTHYYCFLLVPICAWLAGRFDRDGSAIDYDRAIAAATLLVSLPVALFLPNVRIVGPVIARVLLSHYVFGGVMLLVVLAAWRASVPRAACPAPRGADDHTAWNANAI